MGEVIDLKTKKYPLFNDNLREEINKTVSDNLPEGTNSERIVNQVEDTICSHIVLIARQLGEKFAHFLFSKITKS